MPEKTIYRYINVLANKQRRRFDRMECELPFSSTQGKVLHFILEHDGREVFQKDIEEEFGLRPPTATELLKTMEKNGLLCRKPSLEDGRRKQIAVSSDAKKYKSALDSELNSIEKQITKGISREELAVWKKITAAMIENL